MSGLRVHDWSEEDWIIVEFETESSNIYGDEYGYTSKEDAEAVITKNFDKMPDFKWVVMDRLEYVRQAEEKGCLYMAQRAMRKAPITDFWARKRDEFLAQHGYV